MYVKIDGLEILSSYLKDISIGDLLVVQALVTNPLDWHHFYEKISTIKQGEKTDFIVVTDQGDKSVGSGFVKEVEKWSHNGQFGFKIKVSVKNHKSLANKHARLRNKGIQNTIGADEISNVAVNEFR